MKLLFLGTANGLSEDAGNFHSNMLLITDEGKTLLIDCGTDVRFSLAHANYAAKDIDAIYISHLHGDHCGGLEWLGFKRKFTTDLPKPELLIHESLVDPLWQHRLEGGMATLKTEEASLSSYFNVRAMTDTIPFVWEGISLTLIKTVHMISNGVLKPSYGLLMQAKKNKILLTTDTQFNLHRLLPYYQQADLIFHDCETSAYLSGVHANFVELSQLDAGIKSKMWLYHYNDGELPDAQQQGFCGFVKRGQVFDLT
ncbi:MBL fold metallo-hydrolase [Legionella taurinensis]|uniref:MBL fold hydrolase n=1 Tax=Legionella taurinensis TaxID=70611 RepID=A0A3A5LC89_9GAMM|nr:MBL fold metallo-hydrolase [Legionella taurinensis]MDX1836314.1 MBL fold metallo-hydrolase [Legionella taurinensis]PUT41933.1 MBL fold hydrolase [Legionella taurinensis]PUT44722.1 MBL fold hydrolase [Legionella taurinensis]PUT48042.1 MBL fold hydrolase [Legionella taurinensis]PUT48856.1 MBL fold hydrolase [Legionella taurinensis]